MHVILRENLEARLSGNLPLAEQERLDRHLAECPQCRGEWDVLQRSAMGLRSLRSPQDLEWEPGPGFYTHVIERIEREREIPFWSLLLDPGFGRRLVFACLVLLALLGGYVAAFESTDYPSQHRPEAILAGQPAPRSPLGPAPRFGSNLQENRGAVLVALAAEGD